MGDYQIKRTDSVKIREKLDHPVIDGDGHIIESRFVLPDFLNQIGGPDLTERFQKEMATERPGRPKNLFWSAHTGKGTIDRVTTMLPRLYAQRIEEAGIDFCTLFSTMGFRVQTLHDEPGGPKVEVISVKDRVTRVVVYLENGKVLNLHCEY